MPIDVNRFIDAQNASYKQALAEIREGRKTSHWIWYIFPQLKGLTNSATSIRYQIDDLRAACTYLHNKQLFDNYYEISQEVLNQLREKNVDPTHLMGEDSGDVTKLISSLTLFERAALYLSEDNNGANDYTALADCCKNILEAIEQKINRYSCSKTFWTIKKEEETITDKAEFLRSIKDSQQPSAAEKQPKLDALAQGLRAYVVKRGSEFHFHYNFLNIVLFFYWLSDSLWGTDYCDTRNKEVKISAANKLIAKIEGADQDPLSRTEEIALQRDSLGDLLVDHGGLAKINKAIEDRLQTEQNNINSHKTKY